MLLLNVIRAQDNYPLYITSASKVTGTVKADISLGLKIPLVHMGSANANDYFAMPSVDYSSSPSMDVNLLNTKDFMTGFMAPITPEQFAFYWDQGWSSELLLYLLVLRVDKLEVDKVASSPPHPARLVDSFFNQPDVLSLTKFSTWVDELVHEGRPKLCLGAADDAAVGPPLDEAHLGDLKFLVPVAKEGLSLTPSRARATTTPVPAATPVPAKAEDKWQLSKPKHTYGLVRFDQECPLQGSKSLLPAGTVPGADVTSSDPGTGIEYVLTLRSPEGILFYLGQLARMENLGDENGKKHALLIHHYDFPPRDPFYGDLSSSKFWSALMQTSANTPELEPLFVAVDKGKHACQFIIWVHALDGFDYMIPKGNEITPADGPGSPGFADAAHLCATGQSMHALTLVSQLISLQMSAKDFTTTSTVKVVGQ